MVNVMRSLVIAGAVVALGSAFAAPANATLMIAADVNGSVFTCADNQAGCDQNAAPGVLTLGPTVIGGVLFEGSSQFQVVGPPTNALLTNSVQITNNSGNLATIQFAVGGTSFASPTATFSAAGSGTWLNAEGSTIELQWYGDTGNDQGAESVTDLPGVLLTTGGPFVAGAGASAFSTGTLTGPWVTSDPFSWTMFAEGDLVSGATATLAGRSQDITSDVVVPEPASLAILGAGLLGFGVFSWFRRRKDDGGNFASA